MDTALGNMQDAEEEVSDQEYFESITQDIFSQKCERCWNPCPACISKHHGLVEWYDIALSNFEECYVRQLEEFDTRNKDNGNMMVWHIDKPPHYLSPPGLFAGLVHISTLAKQDAVIKKNPEIAKRAVSILMRASVVERRHACKETLRELACSIALLL